MVGWVGCVVDLQSDSQIRKMLIWLNIEKQRIPLIVEVLKTTSDNHEIKILELLGYSDLSRGVLDYLRAKPKGLRNL